MQSVRWKAGLAFMLAVALAAAAAASALPDNPYQRWSSLEDTIQQRLRWMYERIHFDSAPVDVAIIGPSRSGAAVSTPLLEAGLAAAGVTAKVANFSMPEAGRNLNWTVAEQLFAAKAPKLVVIVVIEKPSRFGHPAYKYIAPTAEIIDPGYLGNLNWPADLVYLPFRQLQLMAARLFPAAFDLPPAFQPARYAGTDLDTTLSYRAGDGSWVDHDVAMPLPMLEAQRQRYEAAVDPPILPASLAAIEFGDERTYVARIAEAAKAKGARVAFLFLPYYKGPLDVQERDFYARYGPMLEAGFVSRRADWYSDVGHLNRDGARALTGWLAPKLAPLVAPE